MTDTSTDPFLAGGESLPGAKFENVGDKLTGQIVAMRQVPDLDLEGVQRTWPNGEPRKVWVFDICTAADGGAADVALWVRGNIYTVIREALKEAELATVGAVIQLTHSGLGDPPKKGYHPPKLFTCKAKAGPAIKPPADSFVDDSPF
jgi:hypothetical protein